MTTPADLYRSCRVSAFRLEVLGNYAVTGPEDRRRREAFYAGDPLSPPGPGKQADLALIRELRAAGVRVGRVHVVDVPLTGYLRYELAVYPENAAAGEDVRIADRSIHPSLAALTSDFVVFDGRTTHGAVVWFDYIEDGQLTGYRIHRDQATVTRLPGPVRHGPVTVTSARYVHRRGRRWL